MGAPRSRRPVASEHTARSGNTSLVDGALGGSFDEVAGKARELEAEGYAGAFTAETSHDPFLPLAIVAEHTERLEIGTSIAVAFARTPMTLALIANDLHAASRGRFILGLGSQVKPHIERRFSMPWSHPAPRMREFVLALRAIWSAWNTGRSSTSAASSTRTRS